MRSDHCLLLRLLLLRLDVLQEFSVIAICVSYCVVYEHQSGWVHRVARAHSPIGDPVYNQSINGFLGFNVLHEILLVFAAGVDWWGLLLVLAGGHCEVGSDERGAQGGHGELEAHTSQSGAQEIYPRKSIDRLIDFVESTSVSFRSAAKGRRP